MNLQMGSQLFHNVEVPLLWGTRAVLQDQQARMSIIDLEGERAHLEIVGDKPAPAIEFAPTSDGYSILRKGRTLYVYNPQDKTITGVDLELPECQITPWEIRIGTSTFRGNAMSGVGVGIVVDKEGISVGAPLPEELAKLVV